MNVSSKLTHSLFTEFISERNSPVDLNRKAALSVKMRHSWDQFKVERDWVLFAGRQQSLNVSGAEFEPAAAFTHIDQRIRDFEMFESGRTSTRILNHATDLNSSMEFVVVSLEIRHAQPWPIRNSKRPF